MTDLLSPTSPPAAPAPPAIDLLGLSPEELVAWTTARGLPAFRARQLAAWIYRSLASDFADMTNLSRELRERLAGEAMVAGPRLRREVTSRDGRTRKVLLELTDGR